MVALKEQYTTLIKKYRLPSYDDIDHDFELLAIPSILEIGKPLAFVRRRMNDKLAWMCNLIQSLLSPTPGSYISMYESGLFTKEERDEMSKLLRDLMRLERTSVALDIEGAEHKDAAFVSEIFARWPIWKKQMLALTQKLIKGWEEEKKTQKSSYLG